MKLFTVLFSNHRKRMKISKVPEICNLEVLNNDTQVCIETNDNQLMIPVEDAIDYEIDSFFEHDNGII